MLSILYSNLHKSKFPPVISYLHRAYSNLLFIVMEKTEKAKRTIENHLKGIGIVKSLLEESTYIALECSKFTRLTKTCAGVGLLIASKQRGLSFTLKKVSEMLNIKSKTLFRYFSKMNCRPLEGPCRKIPKLEEMLEDCQAEPQIREKAYEFIENKQCKTPYQAVNAAFSNTGAFLLAQQQRYLLPAKHNKNENFEKAALRLENLIIGRPIEFDSIPCLSLLDMEKEIMARALGITYNQYA